MAEDNREFSIRAEMKRQAYHRALTHLKHAFPDYKVQFQAVVIGVLTSMRQEEFEDQLGTLGIQGKDKKEVGRATVEAAIRANGYILRERKAKMGTIGSGVG